MPDTQPRTITLSDVAEIMKDVVIHSAPTMKDLGGELEELGAQAGLAPVTVIGATLTVLARLSLQVVEMLTADGIQVLDTNGSRSIRGTHLSTRVYKAVQKKLAD